MKESATPEMSISQQRGNFSTVIRKPLRQVFFLETKDKGALINDYLEIHFGMISEHNQLVNPDGSPKG